MSQGEDQFVPNWLLKWYYFNLILIPDVLFIQLRPMSLTGGSLGFLFPLFNLYAEKDKLFADVDDSTTKCIYFLGMMDIFLFLYLIYNFSRSKGNVKYSIACLVREVFVATKTALYLMYSYDHIVPSWRLGITVMNSTWVIVPIIVSFAITNRIAAAMAAHSKTD